MAELCPHQSTKPVRHQKYSHTAIGGNQCRDIGGNKGRKTFEEIIVILPGDKKQRSIINCSIVITLRFRKRMKRATAL